MWGVLLFLHCACAEAAGVINVTQTAKDTADRLTPQAPITWSRPAQPAQASAHSAHYSAPSAAGAPSGSGSGSGAANATLTVDRTKTFQTIEGFGGAFTGSASHLFAQLNASQQERLLDLYFDPEAGLGYTMGRYTIGSCDFALGYYNYAGVEGDTNLTHFDFSHDDAEIVPFVQRAQGRLRGGKLKLVASPWSAPPWMKKNNHMNCDLGPLSCELKPDAGTREAWALYFSKFVDSMEQRGLAVWGVTVQNEPEAQTGNIVYEGMHYTPELERDFVRDHLGPRLRADHPGVRLLIYDHNKDHIVKWAQAILGDNETAQYVWGTAFHWYTGPYFQNLEQTHALFPDFKLLSTESTVAKQKPHTYDTPSWADGEHYGAEIIGDLQHWSTGFIDWNLLLDDFGGPSHADPTGHLCEGLIKCGSDAMVIVDQHSELQLQAFFYYMGHVSKFVPPGSRRIGLANSTDAITATAMLTPANDTVVVAMNAQDDPVSLTLVDAELGTASTVLLPHSIVTLVYRHNE